MIGRNLAIDVLLYNSPSGIERHYYSPPLIHSHVILQYVRLHKSKYNVDFNYFIDLKSNQVPFCIHLPQHILCQVHCSINTYPLLATNNNNFFFIKVDPNYSGGIFNCTLIYNKPKSNNNNNLSTECNDVDVDFYYYTFTSKRFERDLYTLCENYLKFPNPMITFQKNHYFPSDINKFIDKYLFFQDRVRMTTFHQQTELEYYFQLKYGYDISDIVIPNECMIHLNKIVIVVDGLFILAEFLFNGYHFGINYNILSKKFIGIKDITFLIPLLNHNHSCINCTFILSFYSKC